MKMTLTLKKAQAITATQRAAIAQAGEAAIDALTKHDQAFADLWNAFVELELEPREAEALFWGVVLKDTQKANGKSTLTNRALCEIGVALQWDYNDFLKGMRAGHELAGMKYTAKLFSEHRGLFEAAGLVKVTARKNASAGPAPRPMKKCLTAAIAYATVLKDAGLAPRSQELVAIKAQITAFELAAKQEDDAIKAAQVAKKAAAKK